ncbi:amino acid adenylation domain-containing protein [Paludisphaera mucosa]|uniref:Amino acid adenylation domain-containing protein n=1 Tax=Paludisphaera mucosa TaxID=3030827 RepID=A0ABT6FEL1_9BACT|nr:amino acid adenylation domain-containing protein [Paludisphaera mucosa]MDG3006015.1 amino acid adenylation domain-containing protein [Paludisphaera mucosa]
MDGRHLSRLLEEAVARRPDRPAVEDERGRSQTYADLDRAADRVAARLARWGIDRGDRVGLWLPKSLEAVAAIHGILRAGGVYVPVDPTGPAGRAEGIFTDSGARAVVVAAKLAPALRQAWEGRESAPRLIVVADDAASDALAPEDADWSEVLADDAPSPLPPSREADDLAYILFTSGSTGKPKGVMLSHANAFTFLEWCRDALGPWSDDDRYSSHAPFHFDLSIFDLYVACLNAGTLVLIGETLAKEPAALGDYIQDKRISVWYSAPSILAMMTELGRLDRPGYTPPRVVLFAGEVFPIAPLRKLRTLWPDADLWNLYGPTETNVCTALEIPRVIGDEQAGPFPIGFACPPLIGRVVDEEGRTLAAGALGELVIAGPGVMRGYFGRDDLTEAAFFTADDGVKWYRTGDLVIDDGAGCYHFHGRRDRMVKKRGYRIELGEIESALYRHEGVDRAAVIAESDDAGVSIAAFVALKPEGRKSLIAMKRHCSIHLPNYMIPDRITFLDRLPATSTDKVDYQKLKALAVEEV